MQERKIKHKFTFVLAHSYSFLYFHLNQNNIVDHPIETQITQHSDPNTRIRTSSVISCALCILIRPYTYVKHIRINESILPYAITQCCYIYYDYYYYYYTLEVLKNTLRYGIALWHIYVCCSGSSRWVCTSNHVLAQNSRAHLCRQHNVNNVKLCNLVRVCWVMSPLQHLLLSLYVSMHCQWYDLRN